MVFWNSAGFHWFIANVNTRSPESPLAGIIRVFGHAWRDLPWNDQRRTVHYVRSKVERSRACAPLTKKPVWDSENSEKPGFFWQCKQYNKKPSFLGILEFANVNGPYIQLYPLPQTTHFLTHGTNTLNISTNIVYEHSLYIWNKIMFSLLLNWLCESDVHACSQPWAPWTCGPSTYTDGCRSSYDG